MELRGERATGPGVPSSSVDCSRVTVSRELLTAGSEGSGGERRWRAGWASETRDAAGSGTLLDLGSCGRSETLPGLVTLREVADAIGIRDAAGVQGH